MARDKVRNPWRRLLWLWLALAGVLVYGVVGFMVIEHVRFLRALYMTVITLTTVGLGVRSPSGGEMVFTISLISFGVGLVLITVTMAAALIAAGEFGERSRRRRMQRSIDRMRDHFIVCAYGRVGRAVCRELTQEDVPFVVIDTKEELEERMRGDGVMCLIDDPTLEPVLRTAGVERARGLVCAVDSDATNVYITLTARSIKPDLFIVARASEPGSPDRLLRAGADRVVSPFVSSGRHMAMMALRPRVMDVLELTPAGRKPLRLEELTIDSRSSLLERTIVEANLPAKVLLVRRGDGDVVAGPPSDLRLREGDQLLLLGDLAGTNEPSAAAGPRPAG
jgi:voltage-gated potassium channel